MPELQVRKKDGSVEPFLRDKIYNGVVKSGGTPDQADKVVADIEAWAPSVAAEGIINSSDIRIKVLELLKMENPAAAEQFETYKKAEPMGQMPAEPAATAPVEPVAEPMTETPAAPAESAPEIPAEPAPSPVEPPAVE